MVTAEQLIVKIINRFDKVKKMIDGERLTNAYSYTVEGRNSNIKKSCLEIVVSIRVISIGNTDN